MSDCGHGAAAQQWVVVPGGIPVERLRRSNATHNPLDQLLGPAESTAGATGLEHITFNVLEHLLGSGASHLKGV